MRIAHVIIVGSPEFVEKIKEKFREKGIKVIDEKDVDENNLSTLPVVTASSLDKCQLN